MDPDSGEEFCEICPFVRVIFCRKADGSWMSARYGRGKLALTDAGDHGLENGLEVVDGEGKHGELQGHGVLGEEHQVVHGFEEVEEDVLWTSGHGENDVWNVAWCPSGICRNEWRFFCGYEMWISLIWCESDGWCLRLVEQRMEPDWLVVVKVVVELQQEVVVRQLEVVVVLVSVEVVEWQYEVGIPQWIQSCVEVQV